jgi:hypothetical protein
VRRRSETREDSRREKFIANLVKDFDSGKLGRREFCQSVALAALAYASGEVANAQASRGFNPSRKRSADNRTEAGRHATRPLSRRPFDCCAIALAVKTESNSWS